MSQMLVYVTERRYVRGKELWRPTRTEAEAEAAAPRTATMAETRMMNERSVKELVSRKLGWRLKGRMSWSA